MKFDRNLFARHRQRAAIGVSVASLAALLMGQTAPAGCNGNPAVQGEAQAAFNYLCQMTPAIDAIKPQLNALTQNDIAQLEAACLNSGTMNAAQIGVDVIALYLAIEPYLTKVKMTPAEVHAHAALLQLAVKHGLAPK